MKITIALWAMVWAMAGSAGAEEIIAAKFASPDAATATVPAPDSATALPLSAPTEIKIQSGETRITSATEEMSGWRPPFLIIQTGALKANPQYPAWASLIWNVEKLRLTSGTYELSWKLIPLNEKFHGASTAVSLVSSLGKPVTGKLPPERAPLRVTFTDKGYIRAADRDAGGEPMQYEANMPYEFVMTFDLDAKTWSVMVNGTALVDNLAFPADLVVGDGLVIQSIAITGTGVPETGVAVGEVRLVKK